MGYAMVLNGKSKAVPGGSVDAWHKIDGFELVSRSHPSRVDPL